MGGGGHNETVANKPVLTFSGDRHLFSSLEKGLVTGLPTEAIEWKRSFGRSSKTVFVEAQFVPFDPELLTSTSSLRSLVTHPILHTYWFECADIDTYKSTVRDEILAWQTLLKKCGISQDWMIVLVESPDSRKSNKLLPRTSVLDKLKTDVGGKQPERCVSLIDPTKSDSRAAESWQTMLHRLRLLTLQAFNRVLSRFEENMRSQRERRNEPKWSFCDYFLLQEELAFVYEMLGIFDEALVQYDELDALFTQFVLNCSVGEVPSWLSSFSDEFRDWSGLSLSQRVNHRLRGMIIAKTPSIVDIRNYLFSRQCALLLLLNRPWEVARRSIAFLHNCVQELSILEVSCPPGSVACWVFLSALELLTTCERYSESNMQQYCMCTAPLWTYARDKLSELGRLCGLTPKSTLSSEQLHLVVELSAGIRDDYYPQTENQKPNPIDKLKEALSSKEAFQKYYLELSELAISTYKHIGRFRSARMVGLDLAKFYQELGQIQQAVTFLADALKTFQFEEWNFLRVQTQLDLVKCYRQMGDKEKLVKMCAQISSNNMLKGVERQEYFNEMQEILSALTTDVLSDGNTTILVGTLEVHKNPDEKIIGGTEVQLDISIENSFPCEVTANKISVSLTFIDPAELAKRETPEHKKTGRKISTGLTTNLSRTPSSASSQSAISTATNADDDDLHETPVDEFRLDIFDQLDYKQDGALNSAKLICKNATRILRRKDSSGAILKDASNVRRTDFTNAFHSNNITLSTGKNKVRLTTKAPDKVGKYVCNQLSVRLQNMDFLLDLKGSRASFSVVDELPTISLFKSNIEEELLAGIEQPMTLSINTGSHAIQDSPTVKLRASPGLQLKTTGEWANEVSVILPTAASFEVVNVSFQALAALPKTIKEGAPVEHRVWIEDIWRKEEKLVQVYFYPPFFCASKLYTALRKKFINITLSGQSFSQSRQFRLSHHKLEIPDACTVTMVNSPDEVSEIGRENDCCYIWELPEEVEGSKPVLKTTFSVDYEPLDEDGNNIQTSRTFSTVFEFSDFQTLYILRTRVDPASKSSEFCRAATICSLSITLQQVHPSPHTSLMYEVLVDQALWAVCGRAAGVIDMDQEQTNVVIEVMPLVGGHHTLPTVRISKYIPAEGVGESRLEPFKPGQVYNANREERIHVLPPASAGTKESGPNSIASGISQSFHNAVEHLSLP